jgi:hypothetical protein
MHAMKKLRTIYLPNRYIKKVPVNEIAPNEWKIDLTKLHYMRYIYQDKNTISAIDPDGGPFIGIGDKLGDDTIVSITKEGVLICHP